MKQNCISGLKSGINPECPVVSLTLPFLIYINPHHALPVPVDHISIHLSSEHLYVCHSHSSVLPRFWLR